MKKLINLLRGYEEWQVTGVFPERMLNLCAQHRLQFWHLRWVDGTSFTVRTALSDHKEFEQLSKKAMCEVKTLSKKGIGAAAISLGRRWGFLVGLMLCFASAAFLSRFLLVVEVTGNQNIPDAVILSQLQYLGVKPGAYGPGIEAKETANRALLALPELSYMAINIYGTRAQVTVREAVKVPELLPETIPADVVSSADGIITKIRTDAGQAMFQDGDVVAKGEILISGTVDLQEPPYSNADMGYLMVRAAGSVRARTWHTLAESIPLTVDKKLYTGEKQTRYSLKILWDQWDFFENSSISYERYDKITDTRMLTVAGREMPLGLVTTVAREYILTQEHLDIEWAEEQLRQLLQLRLKNLMDAHAGVVLRTDIVSRMEGERLVVTLLAECEEEIGKTVERPGETGYIPGKPGG